MQQEVSSITSVKLCHGFQQILGTIQQYLEPKVSPRQLYQECSTDSRGKSERKRAFENVSEKG